MQNFRIFELFSSLDEPEVKKFGEYLLSPFHNKNSKMVLLYEFLSTAHKSGALENVSRESIWEILYSGSPYNDKNLRREVSRFTKLLEDFMVFTEIKNSHTSNKIILLKRLRKKNLERSFRYTLKETSELFSAAQSKDAQYYQDLIKLQLEKNNELLASPEKNLEAALENLESLRSNIDLSYILMKLNTLHIFYSFKINFNIDNPFDDDLKKLTTLIEGNLEKISTEHPVLYTNYLILLCYMNFEEDIYFSQLKSFVFSNAAIFSREELHYMYQNMHNFALKRLIQGDIKYRKEAFELNEFFERKNIFNESHIEHMSFINIVKLGLDHGKQEWVYRFIKKYSDKIPEKYKESIYNLAMASLYFYKKNFPKSLEYIVKIDRNDYYFYLNAKVITIKIYYEMKETEGILSIIDTNRHYFSRKTRIPEDFINHHRRFFSFINKLVKTEPWNKEKIETLKRSIAEDTVIISKDWLLEKVKELEVS